MEESIYNIIPKSSPETTRKPLYKSRFPPNIPPTSSTFLHHTTSKPGISNISGDWNIGLEAHTPKGATQTFGHLKGERKSDPTSFLKKNTGTMGNSELPPIRHFSYDRRLKREPVPRANERPIYGQRSNKNFILSNAVQSILSSPKRKPQQVNWFKKKDYGENPEYLRSIKQTLNNEYQMMQALNEKEQSSNKMMTEEEIQSLRMALKQKWNQLNKEYQKITHVRMIDTIGLYKKKSKFEKQMAQIENDIKKLNKPFIFIEQ